MTVRRMSWSACMASLPAPLAADFGQARRHLLAAVRHADQPGDDGAALAEALRQMTELLGHVVTAAGVDLAGAGDDITNGIPAAGGGGGGGEYA
jgi:hypothetical protein